MGEAPKELRKDKDKQGLCDYLSWKRYQLNKMSSVLKKALGNRVSLVAPIFQDGSENTSTAVFGLIVDPYTSTKIIDIGPAANDAEKVNIFLFVQS